MSTRRTASPHYFPAFAAAAAAVVLAAACGRGPVAAPPRGPARPSHHVTAATQAQAGSGGTPSACGAPVRRPAIGPLSVTFVTPSRGWLLGVTLPPCAGPGGSRLAVRVTTDGGRHWSPRPAPPAPWGTPGTGSSAGVSQILFVTRQDGWAFGPALWATHDGGERWQQISTHGAQVDSLAATAGHVIAAFTTGRAGDDVTIDTSPAGRNDWHPIPRATGHGSPELAASAGTGYALLQDGPSSDTLLAGPADGTGHWQARPRPCPGWGVIAATPAGLALACALLGVHPAPTHVYLSATGGRTWRRLATVLLAEVPDSITVSPTGPSLLTAPYSGLLLSRDGGHTWRSVPPGGTSMAINGRDLYATMLTRQDGYAYLDMTELWLTHNVGHTWTPVPLH